MIDRGLIDEIKARLSLTWNDDRFAANGEVSHLPRDLAPPPPPEEQPLRPYGKVIDYGEESARKARERGQRAGSAALHRKAVRAAAAYQPAEQPAENHITSPSLNGGPCPKCGHKYSQSKGHTADRRQRRKCKNGGCGFAFILAQAEQAA